MGIGIIQSIHCYGCDGCKAARCCTGYTMAGAVQICNCEPFKNGEKGASWLETVERALRTERG